MEILKIFTVTKSLQLGTTLLKKILNCILT